jgi:hypothetical protein
VLTELTQGGNVNVVGVYADRDEAVEKRDKKRKAKDGSFYDVHEEQIR